MSKCNSALVRLAFKVFNVQSMNLDNFRVIVGTSFFVFAFRMNHNYAATHCYLRSGIPNDARLRWKYFICN